MNENTTEATKPREGEWMNEAPRPNEPKPKRPFLKRPLVAGILILVVMVGAIAAVLFWIHSRKYESTEDAFIDVASQQVSPRVSGRVIRVLVEDNQEVAAGAVVAELDPADLQSAVDQAEAAVAQARAQEAQAVAQKSVFSAQVAQARANLGVAQANAENARSQLQRFQALRSESAGAVSQEQLENATAADKTTAAQVEAALRTVAAAESQVQYADSLQQAAQAGVRAAEARLNQAQLNLSYTKVVAAISGRVAEKRVAVGNEVTPATPLMAIVPPEVYVTANFKETQLAKMRPSQEVTVKVDAYPDLELRGHLQSVQAATGQAFSALPAENATGNWVKVVQRVPVKIILDSVPNDPARRLGPGMSAEVKVALKKS